MKLVPSFSTSILRAGSLVSLVMACSSGAPSGSHFANSPDGGGHNVPDGSGGTVVVVNPDASAYGSYGDGGGPCRNLECNQVDCSSQGKAADATTLSGTVYDPAGVHPIYNAIIYVPNRPVDPFTSGVTCDQCGVLTTGNPVASALSDANGHFVLRNVPVGANVPLVVQVGKWRRQTTISRVNSCVDNPISDPNLTRLPRSQSEGDLPHIAIATGGCDAFECLLRKVGVADSEFTNDTGNGRIHIYQGQNGMGLYQSSPSTTLWSDIARMKTYDLIVNSCECAEHPEDKSAAAIQNHFDYANAGGRVFDTHFNYYWINHGPGAFPTTATFSPGGTGADTTTGSIDTSFPKGDAFATWLAATGASPTKGQIPIAQAKYDVVSVGAPATRWVYGSSGANQSVFHYTFNAPVGVPEPQQCGKVLLSEFHAAAGSNVQQVTFPTECIGGPMTAQELAIEFMLFDLSSCIQRETDPPLPPSIPQ